VIISTFKNGKPNGATLTYLGDGNIKYSFFSDGVEDVLYQGQPLKFVHRHAILDDTNGFRDDPRKNLEFTGYLLDDKPLNNFFGALTYENS